MPDEIRTQRLILRRPLVNDAEAIFDAYAQDPEVCRYLIWTPHTSSDVTRQFIQTCVQAWDGNHCLPYVITRSGAKAPIGMFEARFSETGVVIGYVLARQHWGGGFMPEAITAVTGEALRQPRIFRVQATCDVDNVASQRALEKAGFQREGRLERYTTHPLISPDPRPSFLYSKCR